MFEKVGRSVRQFFSSFWGSDSANLARNQLRVIRKGLAMRVIFFYPGEEGTYVDHAEVILYENGIVHITSNQEETTTHLQNCEILWRFETDAEDRTNKVRLLKPKVEPRSSEELAQKTEAKLDGKPGKAGSSKSPDLIE
jgi:hypothetical protein